MTKTDCSHCTAYSRGETLVSLLQDDGSLRPKECDPSPAAPSGCGSQTNGMREYSFPTWRRSIASAVSRETKLQRGEVSSVAPPLGMYLFGEACVHGVPWHLGRFLWEVGNDLPNGVEGGSATEPHSGRLHLSGPIDTSQRCYSSSVKEARLAPWQPLDMDIEMDRLAM